MNWRAFWEHSVGQSVSTKSSSKHQEDIAHFMTSTFKICILPHMMRSSIMRCMRHAVCVCAYSNAYGPQSSRAEYYNRFYLNPYTVHFWSVCTINQQMHYSDSLLITFYTSYMFRRMCVVIMSLLLSILLSYMKDTYSVYYMSESP
jgi:hypothetical protein